MKQKVKYLTNTGELLDYKPQLQSKKYHIMSIIPQDVKQVKLTQQQFKEECDVNRIVNRIMKTGVMPGINQEALYGDFSQVPDLVEAYKTVQHAEEQFYALDAKTRARFYNDPVKFLEFTNDASNLSEMVKLGLAKEKAPVPTPVVTDPKINVE